MRDPDSFESAVQAGYDRWVSELPIEPDDGGYVRAIRMGALRTHRGWATAIVWEHRRMAGELRRQSSATRPWQSRRSRKT
jgi:hypothetical protein